MDYQDHDDNVSDISKSVLVDNLSDVDNSVDVISNPTPYNNKDLIRMYDKSINMTRHNKVNYFRSKEGLLLLESYARQGMTMAEIARNINVNVLTLGAWREKYPTINYVLSQTREVVVATLESAALKSALGYTTTVAEPQVIKKEIRNSSGKIIGREEIVVYVKRQIHIAPEIHMQQFLLKNLAPDRYKGDAKAIAEAMNEENIQKVLKMQSNISQAFSQLGMASLEEDPKVIVDD